MADTKWSDYEIIDGTETFIQGGNTDVFTYPFPRNETNKVKNYIVKYKNGDVELSIRHDVVTGTCITNTDPSNCGCGNIKLSDTKQVTLESKNGATNYKQCLLTNGCPAYFNIEYNESDGDWIDLDYYNDNIIVKSLSEASQERTATVKIYSDEARTNYCTGYTVKQKAKTTYRVKYEVELCTKGNLLDPDKRVSFPGGIVFTKAGVTQEVVTSTGIIGTDSENGKFEKFTSITANSLEGAINKISVDTSVPTPSLYRGHTGLLFEIAGNEAGIGINGKPYNYTQYINSSPLVGLAPEYMYCVKTEQETRACICGNVYIGKLSDYIGNRQPSSDDSEIDILARYEINMGACPRIA